MKKTATFLLQLTFSCACTLAVFALVYLLICGIVGGKSGEAPIYFSDDGNVLCFFGETLFIDKESIGAVVAYPNHALGFCKGFLPKSLNAAVDSLSPCIVQNGKHFLVAVKNAVTGFFTVGTSGSYST